MTGVIEENRRRFFDRLANLSQGDILDIELAYTMAKFSHRAQVRKETGPDGEPLRYFEHVRRVALVLLDEVGIVNRDMVITALLHDGVEDTRDLTPEMIEHTWGKNVTSWVKVLSKVSSSSQGYVERFTRCTDWQPYVIKACDRLDNLRSLGEDVSFRQKQLLETAEKYLPLFRRMVELAPSDVRTPVEFLRDRLTQELVIQQGLTISTLVSQTTIP